ncbi:MAG: ATP-binding cassette domain-containing protein, partial [Caldilineaceae bacterium]|nr:ATP-binding cassette domain-containing protein [Caldilineaceae bacterium]
DQLSGGERQRVGIARALINKPPLVLADEPTGSLDQAAGERVVALLQSVARQQQSAIVLATHDHSVAQQADRILTMTDG